MSKVLGYTEQPEEAIERVNRLKRAEEAALRELDDMASDLGAYDPRWIAIARTNIQTGFMAAARAVFQPKRIALPGDK